MEAFYYAARGNLRRLLQLHPSWTRAQLAQATGMSLSWVDKWKRRLKSASPTDEQVLRGLSRAPHHRSPRLDPQVWIVCWRSGTSEPSGSAARPAPRRSCTICLVMSICSRQECACRARRAPFTDSYESTDALLLVCRTPPTPSSAPSRCATSNWISKMPPRSRLSQRASSNMWSKRSTSSTPAPRCSSKASSAPILRRKPRCKLSLRRLAPHGLPHSITLDRDTRWVGAPQGSDFPAALIRFCHALGVAVVVCAPHHPQHNGFVERYNRTYQEECLSVHRPTTLSQVREVTDTFVEHYNWQRPHQGISCGNRPPRVAFPALPSLPKVPDVINADAWLSWVDGEHVVRQVNRQGEVSVDLRTYYVSSKLAGQAVTLRINAAERCLQVVHPQGSRRVLPRVWVASAQLLLSRLC